MPVSICIRGLRKSFGQQMVLSGVDLDIRCGTNLVLLGASGSGRTVLMKCMLGLLSPDTGSIEISGRETVDITRAERLSLMRKIGVVFQNGALFDSLPVWQNVAFVLLNVDHLKANEARQIAVETLARVGLTSDVADLRPAELSGGMQKRGALARALVCAPELLWLDAPTAGLDPILTTIVGSLIVASLKTMRMTALTITHDIESARHIAHRAAFLFKGKIVWEGSIDTLDASGNPEVDRFIKASR